MLGALAALSRVPADGRGSHRSSNKSAPRSGSACGSARTRVRQSAARTRTAALPVASARHRSMVGHRCLRRTERKWRAPQRRPAWAAVRAREAAAAGPVQRQAQALVAELAQRRPPRQKSDDSRSPDKTSVTRGYLCRSGYTSPTIAQSLVLAFITSNRGRSESEEPDLLSRTAAHQRASGSRSSKVSSNPMVWARPKPR